VQSAAFTRAERHIHSPVPSDWAGGLQRRLELASEPYRRGRRTPHRGDRARGPSEKRRFMSVLVSVIGGRRVLAGSAAETFAERRWIGASEPAPRESFGARLRPCQRSASR